MGGNNRYATLDGLRGMAALAVLALHIGAADHSSSPLQFGYLGVDLFFMLSGFVMAGAYERPLRTGMTLRHFARIRLIRLYPLMALGALIGILTQAATATHIEWAAALASQFLFLPFLATASVAAFPLNNVQWSLFFELVANACHAVGLKRTPGGLGNAALIAVCALSVAGLALAFWRWHFLSFGYARWNFPLGLLRAGFAYPLGILTFRLRDRLPRIVVPSWMVLALFLVATYGLPTLPFGPLLTVTVAYPAILWLGVCSTTTETARGPLLALGALSFPLYAIHYPIVQYFRLLTPHPSLTQDLVLAAALIAFASLADLAWDRPIRDGFERGWAQLKARVAIT